MGFLSRLLHKKPPVTLVTIKDRYNSGIERHFATTLTKAEVRQRLHEQLRQTGDLAEALDNLTQDPAFTPGKRPTSYTILVPEQQVVEWDEHIPQGRHS